MVDVFKTNVQKKSDARQLMSLLMSHFPEADINFDLQDNDKILRVDIEPGDALLVIQLISGQGFLCAELE